MLGRFKLALLIGAIGLALAGCSILSPPRPSTTLMIALWCPDLGKEVRVLSISFLSPMVTISTSDRRLGIAQGQTASVANLVCPGYLGTLPSASSPYSPFKDIHLSSSLYPTDVKVRYQIRSEADGRDSQGSCTMPIDRLPAIIALPQPSEEEQQCRRPAEGLPLLLVAKHQRYAEDPILSDVILGLCDGSPCNLFPCGWSNAPGTLITITQILKARTDLSFVAQAMIVRAGYRFTGGEHIFARWGNIAAGQELTHSYTLQALSLETPFEAAWLTVVLPSTGGRQVSVQVTPVDCPPPPP